MNNNYVIMTDSDSDMPYELKVKYDIPMVYMPYSLDGKEYYDDLGQTLNHKEYYDKMRAGAVPVTSALNEANYLEYFEPILKESDLLFIAFSSKLSATLQFAYAAREKLMAQYPERKFVIIDTLSICGLQSLLVLHAYEMKNAGKSMDEVAAWVEENKLRSQGWFTVDDLKYLKRGGRISAAAATVGTMLDLKPILVVSKEGKLISVDKVRGRKKSMSYLLEKAVENIVDPTENMGFILHADAPEEAAKLKAMAQEKLPDMDLRIYPLGPVIGAHTGPGLLAFIFMGKERPF